VIWEFATDSHIHIGFNTNIVHYQAFALALHFRNLRDEITRTHHRANIPSRAIADQLRCRGGLAPRQFGMVGRYFTQRSTVIGMSEHAIRRIVEQTNIMGCAVRAQLAQPLRTSHLTGRVMWIIHHDKPDF
jgi:hypothetical protein